MAKLIKGDSVQNIITDGDVIITSPSKIGKTLDEVLVEQQSDIDRLKSNVKYIYAYGGVGGSGSGGSGSNEKPISSFVLLNGVDIVNTTDDIVLDGKGKYKLYIKIFNAGGRTIFVGYSTTGAVTDNMMRYKLNSDNLYTTEIDIDLNQNGMLNVRIMDDEGSPIGYYSRKYIVESDSFNVTLNYTDATNKEQSYTSEPYECFINDPFKRDRYFKIDYSIYLLGYENVSIKCEIDGIKEPIYQGTQGVDLPMEGENCMIKINGEPILQNKYMGTYTLRATLSYIISGREIVRTRTVKFSVVPSGLYINVRTNGDVLYDTLKQLKDDKINGKDGIPYKHISQGSSLMMYCKVFEDAMESYPNTYVTTVKSYNMYYGDMGEELWDDMGITQNETLYEQIESSKGISITFSTEGIKKIVISTTSAKTPGLTATFEKFVYVKKFDSQCDWYNDTRYGIIAESYFRANQGENTYKLFPELPSGNSVLSLTKSSTPIEINNTDLDNPNESILCTVISFGIQVSNINSENVKIVDIYTQGSLEKSTYALRLNTLFADDGTNKISIPTEVLNENDNTQYHLIQIIRNISNLEGDKATYEDSLYIDGMLESSAASTVSWSSKVAKIILNNINVCYNLINIQYFHNVKDEIKFNPDAYAYQYWLAYKEKYVNSSFETDRITEAEKTIMANMDKMFFDGENVVVDTSNILDIASVSDLPTVVFSYDCENDDDVKTISEFMELMWMGRTNGDDSFNSRKINVYWIPERTRASKLEDYIVSIPNNFTSYSGTELISGDWMLDLQGTSTMRNRIKNYSLKVNTKSTSGKDKILFSPKFNIDFKPEEEQSFLPDMEWTIKADIADSAHANNTSIGKFVNTVCTKINTNIPDISDKAQKFVKNTLEGIPVLLYFMCEEGKIEEGTKKTKAYYFGIYNFNLGRGSYYNLGYTGGVDTHTGVSDFMRVFKNLENGVKNGNNDKYYQDRVFTFAVGEGTLNPNIAIAEIQENSPEFDFHQFDDTLLFKDSDNNNNCMFGSNSKITSVDPVHSAAKSSLGRLVRGVAKAGKYCFEMAGRQNDFVTSRQYDMDENGDIVYGDDCVNRYRERKIPDPKLQKRYVNNKIVWEPSNVCDDVNIIDLKELITTYDILGDGVLNKPILNYTSASEYYTICMAFGMVDSVLKNMNLKNFKNSDEPHFYCAFYDMDCALEEANDGMEKITYLAATDYWYSDVVNRRVQVVSKINDYWDDRAGTGFDFTSSYLFAVVKYAKSIFDNLKEDEKYESDLKNYPQRFWAQLRKSDGELRSADYFINKYFSSGISSTFEYLASLNYRVKYLYRTKIKDSDNNIIDKYLANVSAFNGSRKIKVKEWLTKRLRFIDVMMNVNSLTIPISDKSTLTIPKPGDDYKPLLENNPDIVILHSAFDSSDANTAQSNFTGEVAIYAPVNTPFIYAEGNSVANIYMLPGGVDVPNLLYLNIKESVGTHFYGSSLFTNVNKVESMFTSYKSIISDNLEKITYGGTEIRGNSGAGLIINAKSLTEIKLDIPNMGGSLNIGEESISLTKINIAGSSFYGTFDSFPNLQEVNISGVNSSIISVANSDYLTGERFFISGKDGEHKTTLDKLEITGITGKINCVNTNIESISIQNTTDRTVPNFDTNKLSEFSISGDSRLQTLSLKGFRKVSITDCNNLYNLIMDDALEELYISLGNVRDGDSSQKLEAIPYIGWKNPSTGENEVDPNYKGIFDFTNYPNLKKVTLINCDNLVHVKLPDKDIKTDGMSNNRNLKWIDTGIMPAFNDEHNYNYKGGVTPTYGEGPKLILCSSGAFNNCPQYAMLRSDYNDGKNALRVDNEKITASAYKAYTNIIVSDECTSLSDTFAVNSFSYDDDFDMSSAIRFIEECVPKGVKGKIESLSNCFRGRRNILYDLYYAYLEKLNPEKYHKHPTLSEYTSLKDISSMYYNTGVSFISKDLLDLPFENNTFSDEKLPLPLSWGSFISGMQSNIDISNDALYNISYRLDSFSNMKFTIYVYNDTEKGYVRVGRNSDEMFAICDFFYPFSDDRTYSIENGWVFKEGVTPKIFDYVTSISSLNFGEQYIDFRGMFNLFPAVQTITSFLNGDLSKYNLHGLLKPCKEITSIIQSFNDSNISNSTNSIDLYEFFNWEENTIKITNLFESVDNLTNGFVINKHITCEHFQTVISKLTEYVTAEESKLIRLTNIFSYCLIEDYDNREIKFDKKMEGVINISNLFENCYSDYKPLVDAPIGNKGIYKGGVLNIGRTFFENLPNITVAQRTFANTHLSSSLTYDFFCRRSEQQIEKDIFILSDGEYKNAKLYEYEYNNTLINLKECFYNVKFVNCKNWFDQNDNCIIIRNYIKLEDRTEINTIGYEYYTYNVVSKSYDLHMLDNDIIDDCLYNYTDYVPRNSIQRKYTEEDIKLYNHDLLQDFYYYRNSIGDDMPINLNNEACEDVMHKTYCCLPPDILYACSSSAEIDGIFANSNIIGVIPRNLTKKVKNQSISNIFKNVNIMPNLEYYYDEGGKFNSIFANDNEIESFDVEGGKGNDYIVIFRDEFGRLRKRKPVDGDRNLGQFVYVPANFTTCDSLVKAFNFRYNLPRHWEMPAAPEGHIGYYKTTKLFNKAISNGELNIKNMVYHTQYYFLIDNSVNWSNVRDSRNVFITSAEDIDFSNSKYNLIGKSREYYNDNNEIDIVAKNTWTTSKCISKPTEWLNNDNGNIINFYMDLNICGKKNPNNMIEDNGCPIVIKNRNIKLDNFVSGILTVFLNGRVFDETFDISDLKTSYHKSVGGLPIVGYYGFGKNIILPKCTGGLIDENFVFMPIDSNYVYYDFMVDENNYVNMYEEVFGNRLTQGKKVFVFGNKYTFKQ